MVYGKFFERLLLSLASAFLLLASYSPAVAVEGKRVALIMGNDNYLNVHKLEKAGNDANAMARELKAAGFDVTLARDLTYMDMVKKVDFFTSHITGGDQVVIFFAGHGVQLKTGSYLLPTDIEANSETQVERTSISLNDVIDKLSEAKASFALVMVDACRDNPLKSNGRALGASRGLLPPDPPKGQMVVYSASKGQQALDKLNEKDANPNGIFTREFIGRMRKPGVRIEDLVREVQDSVEDLAKSIGHDQRPALYNEARGDFFFYAPVVGPAQQLASVAATPLPAPLPLPLPAGKAAEQIEDETWDIVKGSADVESLEEFLQQYPKGRYVGQAKVAIAKVRLDARRAGAVVAAPAAVDVPAAPLAPVVANVASTTVTAVLAGSAAAVAVVPQAAIAVVPGIEPTAAAPPASKQEAQDTETALWMAIEAGHDLDDYKLYLEQYPNGKYVVLARQRVQKLTEASRAKPVETDLAAWQAAEVTQTADAYLAYEKRFPAGQFVVLAESRLRKLKAEAAKAAETSQKPVSDGAVTPVSGTYLFKDPFNGVILNKVELVLSIAANGRRDWSTGDQVEADGSVTVVRLGNYVGTLQSGALWRFPLRSGERGVARVDFGSPLGVLPVNWEVSAESRTLFEIVADFNFDVVAAISKRADPRDGLDRVTAKWTGKYLERAMLPQSFKLHVSGSRAAVSNSVDGTLVGPSAK